MIDMSEDNLIVKIKELLDLKQVNPGRLLSIYIELDKLAKENILKNYNKMLDKL